MEKKMKMYDITIYEVTAKAHIEVMETDDIMAQQLALELAKAGRLEFTPMDDEDKKYVRFFSVVWTPKEECEPSRPTEEFPEGSPGHGSCNSCKKEPGKTIH